MKPRRCLVLHVDEDRVEELRSALQKRGYLTVQDETDSDNRCTACVRKTKPPTKAGVTDAMFESMVKIAESMEKIKSVFLITGPEARAQVSPMEEERCVEMTHDHLAIADLMGFIAGYEDGSKRSHYLTEKGLAFLCGTSVEPRGVLKVDGKIVGIDPGTTSKSSINPKDRISWDKLQIRATRAVRQLPAGVREFVAKGQAPLMV